MRDAAKAEPLCSLRDWASLRSELLFIYDHRIPAGSAHLTSRRQNDNEISAWLVRRGWAKMEADGKSATADPGQWLICSAREIRQELEPETHLLSIRLLMGWPGGTPVFKGGSISVVDAANHPRLEPIALRMLKLIGNIRWNTSLGKKDARDLFLWQTRLSFGAYARYEGLRVSWVAELVKALATAGKTLDLPGHSDPRLAMAFRVIDSVPPGHQFPEQEVVKVTSMTVGGLNRLCAQAHGFTPYAYWERRRVERARLALEQRRVRVKEVAAELGFLQLSHFSAWFKRHTGKSPRDFRRGISSGKKV